METEKNKCEMSTFSLKNDCLDGQLLDDDCSQSPVNKLPIECLIPIFSFLPIVDRIRIQRVCKYWQAVSLESWSSCKTLGFHGIDWGYKYWLSKGINQRIFQKVLKLCGPYLTRIDFSKHDQEPDSEFVKLLKPNKSFFVTIKRHCPNLTALDIRGLEITAEGLEYLGNNYSNLEEFAIDGCVNRYDDNYEEKLLRFDRPLTLLFRNNKNLRRLILNVPTSGFCLLHLYPTTIEEISVMHGLGGEESICRALKRFKNLKSVIINDLSENFDWYEDAGVMYMNKMLKAIENSENLKELDISTMDYSPVVIHSKNFKSFSNLQKLLLEGKALKIDFNAITNYCTKLTCVKLTGLSVTDVQMASIMQLPELKELTIWFLDTITDAIFLNHVTSLRILNCVKCPRLTNVGFSKLLQNSFKTLQELKIAECEKVNLDKLIQEAKKTTDTQNTGSCLKLIVHRKIRSSCQKQKITKLSKYLEVIKCDDN